MTSVTVTICHSVASDGQGRHTAPLDGFTPGDPMVRVFTYQTLPRGRSPEAIAEDALCVQRPPPRRRDHPAVPPLLPMAAALAVVPRKEPVLPQVLLQHLGSHVVRGAVHSASLARRSAERRMALGEGGIRGLATRCSGTSQSHG